MLQLLLAFFTLSPNNYLLNGGKNPLLFVTETITIATTTTTTYIVVNTITIINISRFIARHL